MSSTYSLSDMTETMNQRLHESQAEGRKEYGEWLSEHADKLHKFIIELSDDEYETDSDDEEDADDDEPVAVVEEQVSSIPPTDCSGSEQSTKFSESTLADSITSLSLTDYHADPAGSKAIAKFNPIHDAVHALKRVTVCNKTTYGPEFCILSYLSRHPATLADVELIVSILNERAWHWLIRLLAGNIYYFKSRGRIPRATVEAMLEASLVVGTDGIMYIDEDGTTRSHADYRVYNLMKTCAEPWKMKSWKQKTPWRRKMASEMEGREPRIVAPLLPAYPPPFYPPHPSVMMNGMMQGVQGMWMQPPPPPRWQGMPWYSYSYAMDTTFGQPGAVTHPPPAPGYHHIYHGVDYVHPNHVHQQHTLTPMPLPPPPFLPIPPSSAPNPDSDSDLASTSKIEVRLPPSPPSPILPPAPELELFSDSKPIIRLPTNDHKVCITTPADLQPTTVLGRECKTSWCQSRGSTHDLFAYRAKVGTVVRLLPSPEQ